MNKIIMGSQLCENKAEIVEKIHKKVVAKEEIPKNLAFLMELGQRHKLSTCLFTIVNLGCIDAIGDEELTAAEVVSRLTKETRGVRVDLLERLLRIAAQEEFLKEDVNANGEAVFSLTDASALLQTDAPHPCYKPMIFHWTEPASVRALTCIPELLHSKDPRETAFRLYHGQSIFDHYRTNEKSNKMFNDYMVLFSKPEEVILVEFFKNALCKDVPELNTAKIVDVGGGYGHIMEVLVHQCPNLLRSKPVVFDLPQVLDDVKERSENLEYVKGSFFDVDTIPEADVYFLKHILHDWSDDYCVIILKHLAAKLNKEGRVLVYDAVLPAPGEVGDPVVRRAQFYLDLSMMGLTGGKERTRPQWLKLGQDAGFNLVRVAEPTEPSQLGRILVFKKE